MEDFSDKRGFICEPVMWIGEGARLIPHDEQHAFRYEVRDKRGTTIGFINTDRARQHPDVKWECSLLRDGCKLTFLFDPSQVCSGLVFYNPETNRWKSHTLADTLGI